MTVAFDRRAAIGGGALMLAGCATTRTPAPAASGARRCLTPVRASLDRVIRTVAGLRPYRPHGFRVEVEPLADKRLVHNYGHGGAGITLSWGSARLATGLGLTGTDGPVAVIGAGAVGLATARLAQEAGFAATLYAKALPPETTSNIAGGQIVPTGHYDAGAATPEWLAQYRIAMDYSWRRFQIMVGEDYGIRWLPTWQPVSRGAVDADEAFLLAYQPGQIEQAEGTHPFGRGAMRRFDTMYVETGRYLERMLAAFRLAGGQVAVRDFTTPSELAALPERVIFNCTGLGSHALFGDRSLTPARGQLAILLPQPEVDYAYAGRAGYMFPRPDGIVLGGTFERGEWDMTPEPAAIAEIVDGHRQLAANWRC